GDALPKVYALPAGGVAGGHRPDVEVPRVEALTALGPDDVEEPADRLVEAHAPQRGDRLRGRPEARHVELLPVELQHEPVRLREERARLVDGPHDLGLIGEALAQRLDAVVADQLLRAPVEVAQGSRPPCARRERAADD